MKRLVSVFFIGVVILMACFGCKEHKAIEGSFSDSCKIKLINNGEVFVYNKGDEEYFSILYEFEKMIEGSHQMPAFGVSIDEDTKEKLNEGLWVEFVFDGIHVNDDLPFESLLIEIESEYSGFNVIRGYKGKYEGRCFYINLVEKTK